MKKLPERSSVTENAVVTVSLLTLSQGLSKLVAKMRYALTDILQLCAAYVGLIVIVVTGLYLTPLFIYA